MHLSILRHGLAEERGTAAHGHDRERALTPEGTKNTLKLARLLKRMEIGFDVILSSPYVRARETAAIVARVLDAEKHLVLTPHLKPGGDHEQLLHQLRSTAESAGSILLVGHEPDLSALISLLLTGKRNPVVALKKGAVCRLAVDDLCLGRCATLEWLLPPKAIKSLR